MSMEGTKKYRVGSLYFLGRIIIFICSGKRQLHKYFNMKALIHPHYNSRQEHVIKFRKFSRDYLFCFCNGCGGDRIGDCRFIESLK